MNFSVIAVLLVCALFQNCIVQSWQNEIKDDRGVISDIFLSGNRPSLLLANKNDNDDFNVGNKPGILNILNRPGKPGLLG